jgi:hypothetical protein
MVGGVFLKYLVRQRFGMKRMHACGELNFVKRVCLSPRIRISEYIREGS